MEIESPILCCVSIALIIYGLIGMVSATIFDCRCKWKVNLNVSPEKFGVCWPFYVPKLISELKVEKKQSNRNMVLYTLHDIDYVKTVVDKNSNLNNNTALSLNKTHSALNQELVKKVYTGDYLEFKGKRYMVDIDGNLLPLKLD